MQLVIKYSYIQTETMINLLYKAFYSHKKIVEKKGDQGKISNFGHPEEEDIN